MSLDVTENYEPEDDSDEFRGITKCGTGSNMRTLQQNTTEQHDTTLGGNETVKHPCQLEIPMCQSTRGVSVFKRGIKIVPESALEKNLCFANIFYQLVVATLIRKEGLPNEVLRLLLVQQG